MWRVKEGEKTSQSEYSRGPSSSMELIAIPNGLAGCKRKIEFDRCRRVGREKTEERTRERGGRVVAQVWHGGLIGCIHALFVGRKEDRKEGKREGMGTGFSPEGRKEGSRAIRDGKSNQLGKDDRDIRRWERRVEGEITYVWGQLSSSRFDSPLRSTGKRIALSIKASLQEP